MCYLNHYLKKNLKQLSIAPPKLACVCLPQGSHWYPQVHHSLRISWLHEPGVGSIAKLDPPGTPQKTPRTRRTVLKKITPIYKPTKKLLITYPSPGARSSKQGTNLSPLKVARKDEDMYVASQQGKVSFFWGNSQSFECGSPENDTRE